MFKLELENVQASFDISNIWLRVLKFFTVVSGLNIVLKKARFDWVA
jgi:hypothetical protein